MLAHVRMFALSNAADAGATAAGVSNRLFARITVTTYDLNI